MQKKQWQKDRELAQKVCAELKKGNNKAIEIFYEQYHRVLVAIVKNLLDTKFKSVKKIENYKNYEDIVNEFWISFIEKPKIICDFKGKSTLNTYFIKILENKIRDIQKSKDVNYRDNIELFSESLYPEDINKPNDDSSLYNIDKHSFILKKLTYRDKIRKIIRKALKKFSIKYPENAYLLGARILEGLTYEEIVIRRYCAIELKEKNKIINRLKKRFERAKKPFKEVILECLNEEGLSLDDLFF